MSWEDQIMDTMQTPAENLIDLQYIHPWNGIGLGMLIYIVRYFNKIGVIIYDVVIYRINLHLLSLRGQSTKAIAPHHHHLQNIYNNEHFFYYVGEGAGLICFGIIIYM